MSIILWSNVPTGSIRFVLVSLECSGLTLGTNVRVKLIIINAVLSGYITTLKNKQKLDVSSKGPSLLIF